jgi:hypothetical protein
VARVDNLEFLADVAPKTTTYKKLLAEKGPDFKPGPQVTPNYAAPDSEDEGIGEGPSNSNTKDEAAHFVSKQNGPPILHQANETQKDGEDVVMVEAGNEQTNRAMALDDPIQEQLAMEMAGHAHQPSAP